MKVKVYKNRTEMGVAAGKAVELEILNLLKKQDEVRMIFAAAPSQNEVLDFLKKSEFIPWQKIVAFHMDEYVGLPAGSQQSFGYFLSNHLFDHVPLKQINLLDGNGGDNELARYTQLLTEKPIDIVCLGIGENGHIAFNDPPVANFNDPETVKVVELDVPCRQQQVNDGCFPSFDAVPTHALTLTIPTLMAGKNLFCVVPGLSKRNAVTDALIGPISTSCPASILRNHGGCQLFLDPDSFGENYIPSA
ncbi:glucosamine-6-phosphate deaminase [Imperialibacter roseus]|uniref:Glucosamine-6-phosphate deaminase n=1 Tax=Imperialibacter roseus TaxID=1324217 RepID=A0ABZ0IPF9_9BACT|nr:glucosamine-6-phosphate deaminase [Imperialibacter roseus]WOK06913.1 glucosamine-6-phosphate deaminase [Imperialibacter roseus]